MTQQKLPMPVTRSYDTRAPRTRVVKRDNWIIIKCPRKDCGVITKMHVRDFGHRRYTTVPCMACWRVMKPTMTMRPS